MGSFGVGSGHCQILPGTGRWQPAGLTEGPKPLAMMHRSGPSTMLRMVPLPVPGRNWVRQLPPKTYRPIPTPD
jgi:hypothetical protein